MNALFHTYRKVLEQCFIPIFVQDEFDTETLLRGCHLAGVRVLEYTLRREDAHRVIPTLRRRNPDQVVFVGSTIDSERIVHQLRGKHPQLMTLAELAPHVDGFVSMLPFSDRTLSHFRPTHLMIPSAETSGEALRQMKHGATFIKVCGPDLSLARKLHAAPTFGYCPTFFTGGATPERMEEIFAAGNILVAAGFDLLLKGMNPDTLTAEAVAEQLTVYMKTAQTLRDKYNPSLRGMSGMTYEQLSSALPHYISVLE